MEKKQSLDKIWLACRVVHNDKSWEVLGIFDKEQEAVAACSKNGWDFVAPYIVGFTYENDMPWPMAYFPSL